MSEHGDSQDRPVASEAEAKAVASAVRLRILRLCLDAPLTNKEIAERLDANPATVLYHVRKLVTTGFLAAQAERLGARNSREVPYLATGKSWALRLSDEHLPGLSTAMLEVFRDEVAMLPDVSLLRASRLGLRLNTEQYAHFERRLLDLLEEVKAVEPGPGARPYSLYFAAYPDVGRE